MAFIFIFILKHNFILLIALADGSALHDLLVCKRHKHLTVYLTQSLVLKVFSKSSETQQCQETEVPAINEPLKVLIHSINELPKSNKLSSQTSL